MKAMFWYINYDQVTICLIKEKMLFFCCFFEEKCDDMQ